MTIFKRRSSKENFFLLLPASVFIAIFSLYPILRGIYNGFTNYKIGEPVEFNGFENYIQLIKNGYFLVSLKNSLIITFGALLLTYFLSLILALILQSKIPCRMLFRSLIIIPWAIPPIVKISVWSLILSSNSGHLNYILKSLGLIKNYVGWYTDPKRATISVVIVIVWGCIPFMTIALLAGLQTIPKDNYEAASVDGASFVGKIRYITLPHLLKVTAVATSLLFIWIMNDFVSQYLLTAGGPGATTLTLTSEAYRQGFQFGDFGYGSAYGNLLILLISIILIIYFRVMGVKSLREGGTV